MELNPNHGVTQEFREQWHKLLAIAMFKLGKPKLEITSDDIEEITGAGLLNITMRASGNVITLQLVSDKEAARLAKEEGGLPV